MNSVAESVSTQSQRRVDVEGLSRTEVHTIVQTVRGETRSDESDTRAESSSGNPRPNHLFKYIQANPHISTADAIAAVSDYRGDIDRYYRSALSVLYFRAKQGAYLLLSVEQLPTFQLGGSRHGQNAPFWKSCTARY